MGNYEKIIKKMQDSYVQKENDLTFCRQRLQEAQEVAKRAAVDPEKARSRIYSMNESVVSSKHSEKINNDDEEGSE
jgi:hypothetical protein